MKKLWFATWEEKYSDGQKQKFFDSEFVPEIKTLENNINEIKQEFIKKTKEEFFINYFQEEIQYPLKSWSTISLFNFGLKTELFNQFSFLKSLIEKEEAIIGAFFSKATAYSEIKGHSGVTNAIYRCHIGIKLPQKETDFGMRVLNKTKPWNYQKFIAFNDCNYHSSWNNTSQERIVLIVDVLKKEFRIFKFYIYSRIYFSYAVLKLYEKTKWKFLRKIICSKQLKFLVAFISVCLIPFSFVFMQWTNYKNEKK